MLAWSKFDQLHQPDCCISPSVEAMVKQAHCCTVKDLAMARARIQVVVQPNTEPPLRSEACLKPRTQTQLVQAFLILPSASDSMTTERLEADAVTLARELLYN